MIKKSQKQNIYEDFLEISNTELQKKLWLNQNNNTGQISSFVELMCRLFDDNSFNEYIETFGVHNEVSNTLVEEMKKLRDLMNVYHEKETDEEIINDSNWLIIVNQARKVLELWDRSN